MNDVFVRTIPAWDEHAGQLRRAFRRWLILRRPHDDIDRWERSLSELDDVDRWELAFSELVANACAASPPGSPVGVEAHCVGQRLTLRVTNRRRPRSNPGVAQRARREDGGRGLLIVGHLLDGLVFKTDDGHTIATAWSKCPSCP